MNAPDWKYAPEWANWLAMDGNGEWWWYELEPCAMRDSEWQYSVYAANNGKFEKLDESYNTPTLQKRPTI